MMFTILLIVGFVFIEKFSASVSHKMLWVLIGWSPSLSESGEDCNNFTLFMQESHNFISAEAKSSVAV